MAAFRSLPTSWDPVLQLWLLRIAVHMDGWRYLVDGQSVQEPGLLRGMGVDLGGEESEAEKAQVLQAIRKNLQAMEAIGPKPPKSTTLGKNIIWLAKTLGLSKIETDILTFLVLAHHSSSLAKLLEKFQQLRTHEVHGIIAAAIGHPFDKVSEALVHTSRLVRSSLVNSDLNSKWNFESKINLLGGVADQLAIEHRDQTLVFLSNFQRSGRAELDIRDFPHLTDDLQILEGFLRHALDTHQRGVNILLWGPPGTGKTQLAIALAERLGSPLYEIATEDRYGNIHKPEGRLGAFTLAQGVLRGDPQPLVLFDEIEDVFRGQEDGERGPQGNQSGRKAWINKLLTENPLPAFWITNTRWALDPAYRRRFGYCLEVGVPPRSVRAKMLDQHLSGLPVSPGWKAVMADHDGLSPAMIAVGARVTKAALEMRPGLVADAVVDRVIGNALEALGAPRRPRTANTSSTTYRLDVLNADRDLGVICDGLQRTGSGRLCLYGPPGTGKTAFGHHVAKVLDRPLMAKRASDLLSKRVGATEANIATAFKEATQDGAVLLMDEIDGFLRDRKSAGRNWEISQVNELLTQMDAFSGVFIASTNLIDCLDSAAIRRFEIKIQFKFLDPAQSVTLLRDLLRTLRVTHDPGAESRLMRLPNLTPGDFASVVRQARLTATLTAAGLVDLLAQECQMKHGASRRKPLGFQARVASTCVKESGS